MDKEIPRALSVEEARKYTSLSRATFYKYINRNEIPHKRVGRRILIPVQEFSSWLNDTE